MPQHASKAARRAGWSQERQAELRKQMTGGDYDHLLRVAMEHFEVG